MSKNGKKILIVTAIVVSLFLMTTLTGCSLYKQIVQGNTQSNKPRNAESIEGAIASGDWVYVSGGAPYSDRILGAKIIGVTSSGKLKEKLIIPLHIDGYKVIGVGIFDPDTLSWQKPKAVFFETKNTKKILVPWEIGHMYADNKLLDYNYTHSNFATSSKIKPKVVVMRFGEESRQYAPDGYAKLIDRSQFRVLNGYKSSDEISPNIVFYYNYEGASNNGIYWADDNELEEEIVLPENPVRKGYTFGGWYSDETCVTEFNQTKYTIENIKIKIFAKWIIE